MAGRLSRRGLLTAAGTLGLAGTAGSLAILSRESGPPAVARPLYAPVESDDEPYWVQFERPSVIRQYRSRSLLGDHEFDASSVSWMVTTSRLVLVAAGPFDATDARLDPAATERIGSEQGFTLYRWKRSVDDASNATDRSFTPAFVAARDGVLVTSGLAGIPHQGELQFRSRLELTVRAWSGEARRYVETAPAMRPLLDRIGGADVGRFHSPYRIGTDEYLPSLVRVWGGWGVDVGASSSTVRVALVFPSAVDVTSEDVRRYVVWANETLRSDRDVSRGDLTGQLDTPEGLRYDREGRVVEASWSVPTESLEKLD